MSRKSVAEKVRDNQLSSTLSVRFFKRKRNNHANQVGSQKGISIYGDAFNMDTYRDGWQPKRSKKNDE